MRRGPERPRRGQHGRRSEQPSQHDAQAYQAREAVRVQYYSQAYAMWTQTSDITHRANLERYVYSLSVDADDTASQVPYSAQPHVSTNPYYGYAAPPGTLVGTVIVGSHTNLDDIGSDTTDSDLEAEGEKHKKKVGLVDAEPPPSRHTLVPRPRPIGVVPIHQSNGSPTVQRPVAHQPVAQPPAVNYPGPYVPSNHTQQHPYHHQHSQPSYDPVYPQASHQRQQRQQQQHAHPQRYGCAQQNTNRQQYIPSQPQSQQSVAHQQPARLQQASRSQEADKISENSSYRRAGRGGCTSESSDSASRARTTSYTPFLSRKDSPILSANAIQSAVMEEEEEEEEEGRRKRPGYRTKRDAKKKAQKDAKEKARTEADEKIQREAEEVMNSWFSNTYCVPM